MPLPEQDILEQGDVLAAQRNPGFETEGLPSPAGFDAPAIAPIPIPGTGLTEGGGSDSYLNKFNQSILGTHDKLSPGKLPNFSVEDVYNPRYRSILPGEDSEEAFGKAQPWYKQWGNALVKMGATAAGTFLNGLAAIPSSVSGNPYDTSMGGSIDNWLKNLEDTFPNYYTKWQKDHPFMSAVPFSGGFSNFWGDKFLKNLGFTIGAIGSAVVQDAVVGAATEGLGEIPMIGAQVGKASLWLNKVFTGTNRAEELLQLGRAAGRTGEQLVDLKSLAQAAAATRVSNGTRYAINLYGASAAEAGVEAREGYNTVRDDLVKTYQREKGYSPTGADMEEIEKYARASGNVRFGVNMALLGISNAIQFDAILKPFKAAKAGFRSTVEREISEGAAIGMKEGTLDTFERVVPKGIWGKVRPLVPSILSEGVFEEGGQYAAQVGTENYYERKYLYDKGLAKTGYSKDETPWDSRDQVKNVVHSVVQGLKDEFSTDEGLENVVLGALTGVVFGGVKGFLDREKNSQLVATTLNLLNSQGVTGVLQNHYDTAATAQRISEDMKQAVKNNDLFKYKNFQHEQFVNFILSGAKAGRFDVRMEQLKMLKEMDNEEFKKAFGLDKTTENVKTASEYVDALMQKGEQIKKSYDLINDTFTNPFKRAGKDSSPEAALEDSKHKVFEDWKDSLTFLASISSDVDSRIKSISSDLRTINPNLDQYHVANFTDKKYLANYAKNLEQEVKSLQGLIDQKVSGDPEADRNRIKSLQAKIQLISNVVSDPNLSEKRFEGTFKNLLQFHLNGQNDDGNVQIPQEALPKLIQYGRDIHKLRAYREGAYKAFDKLSTQEGFEKYFREANNAQDKYSGRTPPPPPTETSPNEDKGPTPPPPPPIITIKGKAGESKDFDPNQEYYVNIEAGKDPVKGFVIEQKPDGTVVVQTSDGNSYEVPQEVFFAKDKNVEEIIEEIDTNTSNEDVPPPPPDPEGGTKEGPMKKDLLFGMYSTKDPIYSREDIPFQNFHKRHQNFLFDMGSSDPDVFNQDNKPRLRIIPVTSATEEALGFPKGFAAPGTADDATIRAVYVIDDTVVPVARNRQKEAILRDVRNSKTISDIIKGQFKSNPEKAITEIYEQLTGNRITPPQVAPENIFQKEAKYSLTLSAPIEEQAPTISIDDIDIEKSGINLEDMPPIRWVKLMDARGANFRGEYVGKVMISFEGAGITDYEVYFKEGAGEPKGTTQVSQAHTTAEMEKALGEKLTEKIIEYASQGLFFTDSKGDKMGRVGSKVDPNEAIFSTFASTDLTYQASAGVIEENYTNKEKLDEEAVKNWWRKTREGILDIKTADGAMQRTYLFAVSRGIPHIINKGSRNNIVEVGLIKEKDLDFPIITLPTLGDVAVIGAFNSEGLGVPSTKAGVSMPLGTPLLNFGGNLIYLNARKFTKDEAKNIFEMLKIISDRKRKVESGPLFKYLHKVIYMANPEKGIAPTASSVTIDKAGNLYLGTDQNPIQLLPQALEDEKDRIMTFLEGARHNIKNSEILRIARDPKANDLEFAELKADDGNVEVVNRWKNYNYYLLSNKTPEGKSRADQPLATNIAVPQGNERPLIQKYSEILSFDFDPSKFARPKTIEEEKVEKVEKGEASISDAKIAVAKVIADANKVGMTVDNLLELRGAYEQDANLADSEKSLLMGAVDRVVAHVQQKNKEQGVKQQEAKKEEVKPIATPEAVTEQEATKQEPVQFLQVAAKKFGFRILSRDAAGNITDIEPVGMIEDDGSITPYGDPVRTKSVIMGIIERSKIKQDDTNSDQTKSTADKFKGRNFKRGTDRYRRYLPGNTDYTKADLDKEFAEVRAMIPDFFTFQKLDEMLKTTEGGLAWGALQDNMIYIYKNAEVGTTYHEAFEAIWYHFVTGKEQQQIYDEFTGRKGEFTTYDGQKKNYSDATVKEAKEQLAEEFREYKMTKKLPEQPKQRSFFRRLLDFIKWLIGMESSDRNRLFKKMNKGYYRNFASSLRGPMDQPEYSYYREPGLEGFNERTIQDMLQGMTAESLGEIFGENSSIIDALETDFKAAAKTIYDRLKEKLSVYFEDEVKDEGTLFAETGHDWENAANDADAAAIIKQMEDIREIWRKIKDNWGSFVKEHERYLRVFGAEFVIDDEGEVHDTELQFDDEESTGGRPDYWDDYLQYDAKGNSSNRMKLLIASIADSEWVKDATRASIDAVRSKRESSSLRLPKLVQYAKLFNYLLHNTAGINGIYDIWTKLALMTEDELGRKLIDANVRKFMSRLKFDAKGFEGKTQSDVRLILSAENTLTKQKPSFFRQFTDYKRNTYFDTTVLNSKSSQVVNSWIASIKGSGAIVPTAENRFLFKKSIAKIKDNITFLNTIGIDISNNDYKRLRGANIRKFDDEVNNIRSIIQKAAANQVALPIISSKQLDIKGRLEKVADVYIAHMVGEDTQSQHPNLDNQPTSNFVLNNWVSTMTNDLNNSKDREEFINRENNGYFSDIFHQDTIILNKIAFNKAGDKGQRIEIGVVEGRETWDGNNKSTSSLTEAERLLYEINNNLNGVFYTLLPADAKTEWAIYVGTYLSIDGFFGDDSSRSNEVTAFGDQMYKWLQTEVNLAKDFENRKFIDALNRKPEGETREVGRSLRFFKDIFATIGMQSIVDEINTKVIDGDTPLENVVSESDMRAWMKEYAEQKAQDTFNELIDWKVIHTKSDGEFKLYGFDKTMLDNTIGKKNSHTKAELDKLLIFREMNYVMNNIEMHKFFFGDPAQYKDELKRIKSFLSGREYAHVDMYGTSEGFNQWANSTLNRAGEVQLSLGDPGYQSHKNHFNTLTAYDVLYESNQIEELRKVLGKRADPYTKGNEDDAGAYMMGTAYREMMWKSGGRFTQKQEDQFQWEMAWERNDKAKDGKYTYSSDALRRQDEDTLKREPDADVAFPILKLMHSGIQTKENTAIVSLDKASWAPLFYRWYKDGSLGRLHDAMQKRGIDYVRMESAHKVGIQKSSSFQFYNETGDMNSAAFDTMEPEMIPIKQIGVQVEQAKKDKGQTEGSQLRKIAIGDLRENGVPVDFSEKYATDQDAFDAWDHLDTEEKKVAASPVYAKIKRHNDALVNLTTNRTVLTMRRLGMEVGEDGSVTIPDKKNISDFILAELERRELPRNIASAVQISPETRDFSNPIEANPQYSKIRSIIYSILEKTITRPKVNGGQKTMLSVTGMEKAPRVVKRTLNGKPVYTSDTLQFYTRGKDGTVACEIMLPYWFGKKLTEAGSKKTKEEVIEYLNSTEEGRKLLSGIGFRIPTQGLNSVDFFVVKDFLPEQMGDVVVLPSEITAKAGSDFDIDKLNVYLRNFYVDSKTGLPELFLNKGSEEATKKYIADLIKSGIISDEQVNKKLEDTLEEENEEGLFADVERRIAIGNILKHKKDILDHYYQEVLENEYFDSIQDLVALPENYAKLIAPNDASELKEYRNDILKLKASSAQPLGDYGKLLSSTFMMKERQAYMASKQVVGISAVSQTAHAIGQNLEGGLVVEDPEYVARFPHNTINGKVSLSGMTIHGSDALISNINSQTTDGGVDVAKDKFLAEMGINKDTLSTFLSIVRQGADPWWAIVYLNQPSIQEFLKEKAISQSVSQINPMIKKISDSKLLKQIAKRFGNPTKKNLGNKPKYYSLKTTSTQPGMEDMIEKYAKNPSSLTVEEKKHQMMILNDFSRYDQTKGKYAGYSALAWELFHFYQGYNWDTARVNDPNLVRIKALKYEKANDLIITPARKVIENTFIGPMMQSVLLLDEGLRSIINVQSGAAGQVMEALVRDIFQMKGGEAAKQQMALLAEMSLIDFAIQTQALIEGRPLNTMIQPLILSNRGTAFYVDAIKQHTLSSSADKKLSENPLIKALTAIPDKRPGFPSLVQLQERDYDTYTSNILTDSFRELRDDDGVIISINQNDDDNRSVAQVYKRMVITAMIQGGARSGRGAYSHLIPSETYSEIVRDALKNMNLEGFHENLAFYRGNWMNSNLVPFATRVPVMVQMGPGIVMEDLNSEPYYPWFNNDTVQQDLGKLMNIPATQVPLMLEQPATEYRRTKVIKMIEEARNELGEVTDRKVRLFRRVDVYGVNGIVPLQYNLGTVLFAEINSWGDANIREYYSNQTQSVLPSNNKVMEANDDQILFALIKNEIKVNAAEYAIGDVVNKFGGEPGSTDEDTEDDGNPPVEPKPILSANHAMSYKMPASENLTGKDTTTLELAEQGLRTATTRSFPLGKMGDLITFENRPQVYRITGIEQLTSEKVGDPNWINQWSQKEQWTTDHFRKVLGGQTVHIGSWQTSFERVEGGRILPPTPITPVESGAKEEPAGKDTDVKKAEDQYLKDWMQDNPRYFVPIPKSEWKKDDLDEYYKKTGTKITLENLKDALAQNKAIGDQISDNADPNKGRIESIWKPGDYITVPLSSSSFTEGKSFRYIIDDYNNDKFDEDEKGAVVEFLKKYGLDKYLKDNPNSSNPNQLTLFQIDSFEEFKNQLQRKNCD